MARRLDFGLGELDLDVLQARYQQRWRPRLKWLVLLLAVLVLVGWGWTPLQQHLWGVGRLTLTTPLAPDTTLALNGTPVDDLATPLLAGTYDLTVQQADAYPVTLPVTITREQTTTVTVPPLRPRPLVQPIALPAPEAIWQTIQADPTAGWRLTAQLTALAAPETDGTRPATTLLQVTPTGVQARPALTAYPAADEVTTVDGRFWAAWEPLASGSRTSIDAQLGHLTLQTPPHTRVLTTTTLSGLWWSPAATDLLLAQPQGLGQNLYLGTPRMREVSDPVVRIPGTIQAVHWHPTGQAAVVLSVIPPPADTVEEVPAVMEATLVVRGTDTQAAHALRLAPPPDSPAGLVPLAWTDAALWWPGQVGADLVLDRIPFTTGFPTRQGTLPDATLALRVTTDAAITVLVATDDQLQLQRWPDGTPVLTLDDLPLPEGRPLRGQWQDTTLLLATTEAAWQLPFVSATLDVSEDLHE